MDGLSNPFRGHWGDRWSGSLEGDSSIRRCVSVPNQEAQLAEPTCHGASGDAGLSGPATDTGSTGSMPSARPACRGAPWLRGGRPPALVSSATPAVPSVWRPKARVQQFQNHGTGAGCLAGNLPWRIGLTRLALRQLRTVRDCGERRWRRVRGPVLLVRAARPGDPEPRRRVPEARPRQRISASDTERPLHPGTFPRSWRVQWAWPLLREGQHPRLVRSAVT